MLLLLLLLLLLLHFFLLTFSFFPGSSQHDEKVEEEHINIGAIMCRQEVGRNFRFFLGSLLENPSVHRIHLYLIIDEIARNILGDCLEDYKRALDIHVLHAETIVDEGHDDRFDQRYMCSGYKLNMPNILPEVDRLLLLDVDLILMEDIANLWAFWDTPYSHRHDVLHDLMIDTMTTVTGSIREDNMLISSSSSSPSPSSSSSGNVVPPAGNLSYSDAIEMAFCLENYAHLGAYHWNKDRKSHFFNETGVNTGVSLLNLRLMRKNKLSAEKLLQINDENIFFGDQDVINTYAYYFPEFIAILPCQWNQRTDSCCFNSCETQLMERGIFHGNRKFFNWGLHPAIDKPLKKDQNVMLRRADLFGRLTLEICYYEEH